LSEDEYLVACETYFALRVHKLAFSIEAREYENAGSMELLSQPLPEGLSAHDVPLRTLVARFK
jgi:hypothetical protein